jgi:uncharacterized protein (TIGR02444 family)
VSAFWHWALEACAKPGAAEALLRLQDERGANVPLLLWTVWCARHEGVPEQAQVLEAAALTRDWEEAAVGPLRAVRRRLKQDVAGIAAGEQEAFRQRVKAVELEGERVLMTALEPLAGSMRPEAEASFVAEVSAAYGAPLRDGDVAALLALL